MVHTKFEHHEKQRKLTFLQALFISLILLSSLHIAPGARARSGELWELFRPGKPMVDAPLSEKPRQAWPLPLRAFPH